MFLVLVVLLIPFYFCFKWLNGKKRKYIGGTSFINKKFGIDKQDYETIEQKSSDGSSDSPSNENSIEDLNRT